VIPTTYKLLLVKDKKVLAEVPLLTDADANRDFLEKEIDEFEEDDLKELSELYDTFSNEDRLRMITKMLTSDEPVRFVDFMNDLELNQKLVSDYCKRMMSSGLVRSRERGKYEVSPLGLSSFLVATVALRRIMKVLEDEME
jgi:predicted transcriptional regulator